LSAAGIIVGLIALLVGCGGGDSASTHGTSTTTTSAGTKNAQAGPPAWLWVQQARRGTFTRDKHGWQLRLTGAQDDLASFTDRPHRLARVESLTDYLAEWQVRFRDSHPNAAIVIPREDQHGDVLVVTLHEPVVQSRSGDELLYRATVLPLSKARNIEPTGTEEKNTALPRSFADPVLFIDSYWETPDTQYTVVKYDKDGRYSIWPTDRDPPLGWDEVGKQGTKAECLDYIERVWSGYGVGE
jgi:MbtH protein